LGEEIDMALPAPSAAPLGLAWRLRRGIQGLAEIGVMRLLRWQEVARQRRALLALSDAMLKDIGISRADAEREARRPFWSEIPARTGDADLSPRQPRC
jgi:uncharacterized protein YjiS (DUF1127 family)